MSNLTSQLSPCTDVNHKTCKDILFAIAHTLNWMGKFKKTTEKNFAKLVSSVMSAESWIRPNFIHLENLVKSFFCCELSYFEYFSRDMNIVFQRGQFLPLQRIRCLFLLSLLLKRNILLCEELHSLFFLFYFTLSLSSVGFSLTPRHMYITYVHTYRPYITE